VDNVWLDNECARYEYFADVIQSAVPDLAIVALDADKTKALQLIGQLAVEHPTMPILTISHDHQALLQSLQKGAKFFLTHPVGLQDMLDALRRVFQGSTSVDPTSPVPTGGRIQSSIVAVMGSRGGVGTTTLAVNLAATLASDPANQAALID